MRSDVLRLIIAKSPAATREAIKALRASDSPTAAIRYGHVLTMALEDPQGKFAADERVLLASQLPEDTSETLDYVLKVRLSGADRLALERRAEAAGVSLSEWARQRLLE